ncbi:MAG: hypothetical protein KDK36_14450 [Leptospiraceae bacterium]|nr:hypothetical protein [Leptospiraceae bacterium]
MQGSSFNKINRSLVAVLLFFSISLNAETIILRNGKTVQGKVLGHDSESVTINVDGNTTTIPKTSVYKVIFSSSNSEIKKFLSNKKTSSNKSANFNPNDSKNDFEIDDNIEDKKKLTSKLTQLERKINKLERKISRLKQKIAKIKVKIKEKQMREKKLKTTGKS